MSNALYRMQVNLHGSVCIPGVFLYCFGHRKRTKFSSKNPRKYAILTPKSQKNFLGGGTAPSPDISPVGRGTPSPYTPPPLAPLAPRLGSRLRRSTLTPQLQLLDPPASYCTTEGSVFQSGHQFTTAMDRQTKPR